jgi:AcrR family transcriptional regulator
VRTKSAQQSEKILMAAARLFACHRFHETRMEDIAAAAEVGKGTLYRYFEDKDELYAALLSRAARQLEERLQQELAGAATCRDKLKAVVHALITYFDEQPHLFDLIGHAEAMQRPDRMSAWQKTRESNFRLLWDILAAAKEAGEFVVDDTGLASLSLFGTVRAVLRFSKPPRAADLGARIVEQFLHGNARPATQTNGREHEVASTPVVL